MRRRYARASHASRRDSEAVGRPVGHERAAGHGLDFHHRAGNKLAASDRNRRVGVAEHDGWRKRQTYARFGVKEYWVVEPVVEVIEISRLQENVLASAGVFSNEDKIESPLLPDLSFAVKDLFRK